MNKLIVAAAFACVLAVPAVAEEPEKVVSAAGDTVEASDPAAAAIVADCSARKFETRVEIEKDGKKRFTRMKLCAAANENEANWVKTLHDAKAKISAHPDISDESKAKIAVELDAEIAKLKPVDAVSIALPAAPPRTPAPKPEYSVYSPLPKGPAAAAGSTLATSAPAQAPAKKPRLTIKCLAPGEKGGGSSCLSLDRTTQLAIRADEDLVGGASLRFLRRGDERGEISLAAMRQGQLIRSKLPPELCAGVASSKVEIQVMGSNQVAETLGPYKLRC